VSSQDDEATPNDKFVALELLKNANVAAGRILPGCQDTGTAIIMGKKGQQVRRLLVSTSAPAPS
jgi:fumarate hydratase class I